MLNPRILIVLSDFADAETLTDTVLDALAHAGRPYSLRFAFPSRFGETARAALEALPKGTLADSALVEYDERAGLAAIAPLIAGDTHFLALSGRHGFGERWERALLSRFALIGEPRALLTAVLRGQGNEAQAFLPAFAQDFTDDGVRVGRGLPLIFSAKPVRTLALHPAFLFGRVAFLREAETARETLSIAAQVAGFTAYALDIVPLWPLERPPAARLRRPAEEALPSTHLTRFERLAGISFEQRIVSARAALGLFTTEDGYPQRLPPRLEAEQRLRARRARRSSSVPLMLTAFCDWPAAHRPPIEYLIHFSYLQALTGLPLQLYAGGAQERALRARFPNVLAYPDNGLLPRALIYQRGMSVEQHFRRGKWLLMRRALRSWPNDSHVAWVDMDVLPHPVAPCAALDFSALMDDRVHLGWVAGAPDASFIVAPAKLIELLVREVQAITQLDADLKRGFSERAMLLRLIDKYPDLFALHPMPERERLFLTGLDPRLLSARMRGTLSALPPALGAETMKEGNDR